MQNKFSVQLQKKGQRTDGNHGPGSDPSKLTTLATKKSRSWRNEAITLTENLPCRKFCWRPFWPRRHRVEVPAMRPVSCGAFDRRSFHWTRVVQIHADSRTILHTGVRAQAVQSGTARSEVLQVSDP